jgi:hypothetical protein
LAQLNKKDTELEEIKQEVAKMGGDIVGEI